VAIALVRIEAVRYVGIFGSLGVLAVTASTLTLVPAGLRLHTLGTRPPRGAGWIQSRLAGRLVEGATRRRRRALVLWCLGAVVFALGIGRVDVETDATQWLPRGNPVRDSYESIRSRLSGISPVNVVLEAPDRSVLEPEVLSAIDSLASYLESLPDVGKAVSIADPLRQIHGGFLDAEDQPLPQERALAEQYLLLLESVEHVADLVTDDRSAANVLLRVDHNGSSHLLEVADAARAWWQQNGVAGVKGEPTGIMYEYARAEDEIAFGQLRGLSFALSVISVMLLAIFRWPRLALVALVPNVIPLAVIFGLMGLLSVPLDAGTVLVGSLALGIAVDDTIHVTSGFFDRIQLGLGARDALHRTFVAVLPALVFTTIAVALAFVVLGFSEFTFTRNLGLLTAAIMVLCLLADVTLLPALLLGLPARPAAPQTPLQEAPEAPLEAAPETPLGRMRAGG
jgi:predicted RND superfamily exporter protein